MTLHCVRSTARRGHCRLAKKLAAGVPVGTPTTGQGKPRCQTSTSSAAPWLRPRGHKTGSKLARRAR